MFSREFYEISKNTFFTEHLWTTASAIRWLPWRLGCKRCYFTKILWWFISKMPINPHASAEVLKVFSQFNFVNFSVCNWWVTYRFSNAIRHNDVRGWVGCINEVLKFRKVIEFESSCIVICFSYVNSIIDGKISIKKAVKNLQN